MKKAIAIIVSVLFVFAITSLSVAAEKKAVVKVKQVTGEVTMVDTNAKTITVKGKKGDVVIGVDEKMMADVKAGDKVVAKYTEADGKNTAKSVKKAAAKVVKKGKKETAAPAPMETK
jgi:Cu/Ag efflux protein CusF